MTTLEKALKWIGGNPLCRTILLDALRELETKANYDGPTRDDITGPIADAMFDADTKLTKQLQDGTQLTFLYRSKIAREFVLSNPAVPNHAWEPQTTKLLVHFAAQSKQAIVGGAYFGDHTTLMAKAMQANAGVVHAFEPNADQALMLQNNANANGLTNVVVRQLALWDKPGQRLRLVGDDALAHSDREGAESDPHAFSTEAIDHYLKAQSNPKLDLIMLDIEGGELLALSGARETLAQAPASAPVIVFEIHAAYVDWSRGLLQTPIGQLLAGYDYELYAVRDYNANMDMSDQPIELIPAQTVVLDGPPHGFNMLAIKKGRALSADVFRFRNHVSPKLLRHKDALLHAPIAGA
jgi:FkbM family methyltransferase